MKQGQRLWVNEELYFPNYATADIALLDNF